MQDRSLLAVPSQTGTPTTLSPLIFDAKSPSAVFSSEVPSGSTQPEAGASNQSITNTPVILQPVPLPAHTMRLPFLAVDPMTQNQVPISPILGPVWTSERQENFEKQLARLTASAGLPLSWIDNPEWHGFCEEFVPAAKSLSRKALTIRVIPKLVEQLRNESKAEVKGKHATLQADGWTGENHRHLIAFMITANQKVTV